MSWRWGIVVLGTVTMPATATAAGSTANRIAHAPRKASVRLVLAHRTLRAGQMVQVVLVNRSSRRIMSTDCLVLQRRKLHGWTTINSTHRVRVWCPINFAGPPQSAHSRAEMPLVLFDDLRPGFYRILIRFKFLTKDSPLSSSLRRHHRSLQLTLRVLKFRPRPLLRLPERRIRRIALRWAVHSGDGHPTLIQHAEGTRFEAELIAAEDLSFKWSWSYLVGVRGHFTQHLSGPHGGSFSIHGSVMTIVVSAKTGRLEALWVSDHYPHLGKLGSVSTDYRRDATPRR
jgi:hypothetical protein